jgi:Protein of unknown function (DUF2877)
MTPLPSTTVNSRVARALSIGAGVREILDQPTRMTIVGHFSFGFYVRSGEHCFAVGSRRLCSGPIHAVVDAVPDSVVLRPRHGAVVSVDRDALRIDDAFIELNMATDFVPSPLPPAHRARAAALLRTVAVLDRPPDDLLAQWASAQHALCHGRFDEARQLLQGRGQGLTPSGDDVLAGALVLARVFEPTMNDLELVADALASSALSRNFVHWAARGHSIAPVHELIDAAAHDDAALARVKAQAIRAIGSSSGTAVLCGLASAAQWMTSRFPMTVPIETVPGETVPGETVPGESTCPANQQ